MARPPFEVRIKRVYDPPEEDDGVRILVDRLWPRSPRKERVAVTSWLKEVAPSWELRKWFGHDPARWAEFSRRYRSELVRNRYAIAKLAGLSRGEPVALLYAAHDAEHNHALVLADYIRRYRKDFDGHRSA